MLLAQCSHEFSASYGLPVSLFLAGLAGGFTHCAGMCAPFVLAQSNGNAEIGRLRGALLLPYHFGRMTTYVILAVLVSGFINMAFLFSEMKALISAPLLIIAGLVFFVTALPRLGAVFPWILRIQLSLPYKFVADMASRLSHNPGALSRYFMGVLLGFMPCGLVLAALMASASAPSPLHAAVNMSAFTLGTVPALIAVAWGGGAIKRKFPNFEPVVKRGALVLSGLWLFLIAGLMIF